MILYEHERHNLNFTFTGKGEPISIFWRRGYFISSWVRYIGHVGLGVVWAWSSFLGRCTRKVGLGIALGGVESVWYMELGDELRHCKIL